MPRCLSALSVGVLLVLAGCLELPGIFPDTKFGATVAAAGDIACEPGQPVTQNTCRMEDTAQLVEEADPQAVLVLGDAQYRSGSLAEFQGSYQKSWGRFRSITYPAPGNHEYWTNGAAGYFAYFGSRAGSPEQSWYAFDVEGWRIYSLNSNCSEIGGCGPGSPQYQWLQTQLASDDSQCSLAYWHQARFSSGKHGDAVPMTSIWQLMDSEGVDVALTGHDHHYERFAPMTAQGSPAADGIRQFVVGTGGSRHYPVGERRAGSEAAHSGAFGVLLLDLDDGSYAWRFQSTEGSSYSDSGAAHCT